MNARKIFNATLLVGAVLFLMNQTAFAFHTGISKDLFEFLRVFAWLIVAIKGFAEPLAAHYLKKREAAFYQAVADNITKATRKQ